MVMKRKLLLLGGSAYALPVIKKAQELGCEVITCDYLPDNIAHKYSDYYVNASIIQHELILKIAEELKIDGIMSFACDPGVVTAAYVAEKLKLPSAGSYESVKILQNKPRFRSFLREHGFQSPMAKGYHDKKKALSEADSFRLPIIVKPADSAGSKGVSKVDEIDCLKDSIELAFAHSISSSIIIEEYIESKGAPSDSECFSVNGELKFVSYSSQYFDVENRNPFVPSGFTWKPEISEHGRQELTKELQRLLSLLNMGTSLYNVEARENMDGTVYLMEVSPRGGGNRLAEMLRYITGVDLIELSIRSALGEEIEPIEEGVSFDHRFAELILHSRKAGIFKGVQLSDDIKDCVVEQRIWVNQGDFIDEFSGANKTIGTLIMKFDSDEHMNMVMSNPERYVFIQVD